MTMQPRPDETSGAMVAGGITLDWGELRFRRAKGEGHPLVLLHPLAESADLWTPIWAEFGAHRDVIAIDLRGHGESGWNGAPFSIRDLAGDVAALLDALGIARADFVGMSMGGCVAMTVATETSDHVRRLALCDTTAWYGPDAVKTWDERAHAAAEKPREALVSFQTDRWFNEGFRAAHPELVQHAVDIFLKTKPAVHAQACRALGAFDARDAIGGITAPTLVLTGEEDYATPPAMGEQLAQAIPGAEFRQWPGVRHFSVLESRDLRAFIARYLEGGDGRRDGSPAPLRL